MVGGCDAVITNSAAMPWVTWAATDWMVSTDAAQVGDSGVEGVGRRTGPGAAGGRSAGRAAR